MTILVTGANGFIGRGLVQRLTRGGYAVRGAVRTGGDAPSWPLHEVVAVGDIGRDTDWSGALDGVDVVVHLAARTPVMDGGAADEVAALRRVNTEGTERLAWAAAQFGVRRFVYVSSVKVNGERTAGRAFTASDRPAPANPYAISKWEAEQRLGRIAADTSMEVVTVRPPLVYGPGVKANFLRLLTLVARGIPLPLARVDNRRSLVALDNLVDCLMSCIRVPAAAGKVFLVSDGEDLSTPELVRRIASKMGCAPRLFPFSPGLLRRAARMVGRQSAVERVCGSLQVDIGATRRVLGWTPPVTVDAALERTVAWYRRTDGGTKEVKVE